MKIETKKYTGNGLFHRIEDAFVITSKSGSYEQRELYQRSGILYAQHLKGFARLMRLGTTSVPSLSWDEIIGVAVSEDKNAISLKMKA